MTLIEFFSEEQIENVVSSLVIKPQKVIFIGYEEAFSKSAKETISKYLGIKGIKGEIEFITVKKHNLSDTINVLESIYKGNDNCIFDFTGGEELILAAMGYVMAKYDVTAIEYNVSDNCCYMNLADDKPAEKMDIKNSIYENILLHGGTIDERKQKSSKYAFSDNLEDDIYKLWDICKENNSLWNSTVSIFKNLDGNEYPQKEINCIFDKLEENGFIKTGRTDFEYIEFSYKNSMVKFCLTDPGAILELYTYCVLSEEEKLNDVKVGVSIDWDGKIHGYNEKAKDTSNEIDVVAMEGIIPLYVSCKNGKVTKEALYELETVSNRFGGVYSKKVLVAPILREKTISNEYIKNRAEDMGITVITDVSKISKEKYREKLLQNHKML